MKTSSHMTGRPRGAGTGKHRFPLRCPSPMFIAEQMAQEQVVTNNFPLHQLQVRRQCLLSPPGLALSVPPCPSAAHAPLPRQNSLVRLAQCWLVTGAGKGQGPPCRASVRDGANGPAGQLIGHLRQVSVSPALELLPAGARRHQSSAQGGHQGTIWRHLTGHSAAGA